MPKHAAAAFAAALLVAGAPLAAGAADSAAGEKVFAKRCATCHAVVSPSGEVILKGGSAGPNQFGLIGRRAGSVDGFAQYGETLKAAGEAGLVWSEAELVAYLADPREYLRERTGDAGAKSRMAFKLRDEAERADVAAYLATQK
jgi:cytochrome c